jgi:hypothetical protein
VWSKNRRGERQRGVRGREGCPRKRQREVSEEEEREESKEEVWRERGVRGNIAEKRRRREDEKMGRWVSWKRYEGESSLFKAGPIRATLGGSRSYHGTVRKD